MDRAEYMEYVEKFNHGDPHEFIDYYAEDITFNQAGRQRLEGREEVLYYYRRARETVEETASVNHLVIGDEYVAAEMDVEFTATDDWPIVSMSMREGETALMTSHIHYRVEDGRFAEITASRIRSIPPEEYEREGEA